MFIARVILDGKVHVSENLGGEPKNAIFFQEMQHNFLEVRVLLEPIGGNHRCLAQSLMTGYNQNP
jgi:hypothetical protein